MARLLKEITENIVGIDIHPFAVAMARVNYLLAILDFLTPEVVNLIGEVKIPIYWSDSLIKSSKNQTVTAQFRTVKISLPSLGSFNLPLSQEVNWDVLAMNIRKGIDSEWTTERFLKEFSEDVRLKYEHTLETLFEWFKNRKNQGKDGRWISVLRNASIVEELQRKCSFVVGNPPWVREKNIDEQIRKRLNEELKFCQSGWKLKFKKTKTPFGEQYLHSFY